MLVSQSCHHFISECVQASSVFSSYLDSSGSWSVFLRNSWLLILPGQCTFTILSKHLLVNTCILSSVYGSLVTVLESGHLQNISRKMSKLLNPSQQFLVNCILCYYKWNDNLTSFYIKRIGQQRKTNLTLFLNIVFNTTLNIRLMDQKTMKNSKPTSELCIKPSPEGILPIFQKLQTAITKFYRINNPATSIWLC